MAKHDSLSPSDKCKLASFVLLQDAAQTQFCDHFKEMLMAIHLTLFTGKHNIKGKVCCQLTGSSDLTMKWLLSVNL